MATVVSPALCGLPKRYDVVDKVIAIQESVRGYEVGHFVVGWAPLRCVSQEFSDHWGFWQSPRSGPGSSWQWILLGPSRSMRLIALPKGVTLWALFGHHVQGTDVTLWALALDLRIHRVQSTRVTLWALFGHHKPAARSLKKYTLR